MAQRAKSDIFVSPILVARALHSSLPLPPAPSYSPARCVPRRRPRSLSLHHLQRLAWEVQFLGAASMALRRMLGFSDGELMRSDAKPCSRLMRQTAAVFAVGGSFGFWVLCRLHYGPRITVPRSLRWASCGALTVSTSTAILVRLFSPECEPQNIATYDNKK